MKVCFPSATGLLAGLAIGWTAVDAAGGGLQPMGLEFPLTRGIPGDQVNPAIALQRGGGWVVWQDAAIDGEGLGIAAIRIGENGSPVGGPRRVNQNAQGEQENASVCLLPDGRFLVLWQGGTVGFQKIYGRLFAADGSPLTSDIAVSTGDGEHQLDPVSVPLKDGSIVVAWTSYRQDGSSSYDVFARRLSPNAELQGEESRLNVTQGLNRRSPALAPLGSGGFLAAWVTERQTGVRDNRDTRGRPLAGYGAPTFAVQLVARSFSRDLEPSANETAISESGFAANPVLSALSDGGVYAAWTRRDPSDRQTRYDVFGRLLDGFGIPQNGERLINVTTVGDQYRPRLAVSSHGILAVWTSMGQDGSWEGVFGRWVDSIGEPSGDEIPINTQTGGGQVLPTVATGSDFGMMVAYSSNQPRSGHELFAQRLAPLLLSVRAAGAGRLQLTWPTVPGGVYQLQTSVDARSWRNIGSTRTASGEIDELAITAPGQMVLYRIVRVR